MTEVYGPGAFLLAGTEVYRMAKDEIHGNNISAERIREIGRHVTGKTGMYRSNL